MKAVKLAVVIFIVMAILAKGTPAEGAEKGVTEKEYMVKAAMIYKMIAFVKWPAMVSDANELCVYGKNPFGDMIYALETGGDRKPLRVKIVKGISESKGCHILFVSKSEKANLKRIIKALNGMPVLTISDIDGFAKGGGMIEFVKIKKRIGFEINKYAADSVGIKISSRLLILAQKVYGKDRIIWDKEKRIKATGENEE